MVHLLETAPQALGREMTAPDEQDGAVGEPGVGDPGDRVGDPGSCGGDDDTKASREPGVCVRGVRSRLLVPHVDDADAFGNTAVDDRENVAARQSEHRVDAFCLEGTCDGLPTVYLRHFQLPVRVCSILVVCGCRRIDPASSCTKRRAYFPDPAR